MNDICGVGNIANKAHKVFDSFHGALFTNICLPLMWLLFQYIPLMIITMLIYFSSSTICFINGCLWQIPYIRIWRYKLSRGGRSFCEIIRDSNPYEHARPKTSHDCSRSFWIKQKYINEKWVIRTQRFNSIARNILQFSSHTFGYYPHFLRAIFGACSFSLFGFSVIYFYRELWGTKSVLCEAPRIASIAHDVAVLGNLP